ncbi:DUF1176 domain-containing protein [Sphingosinicella sp. YJ22]|uniref:DUF1176 domain-containing protein n=1 Tax=Sphingosinicella sp. YJ22 TaxID=1104780 RepID=UPI00140B4C14|nr:DUF1176 domain-containing protein [Sphingosinicella sp. YJ22]
MILLSLLLAAAAVQDAPTPSEIHNFHDWVVTCDNGLRCQAVSLVPEETRAAEPSEAQEEEDFPWERYAILRLERGPEADAPLDIVILDFEGTPARLVQYGRPLEGISFTPVAEGEWRLQAADLPGFIDRLYVEKMVVQDAGGRRLGELAVHGAHGALLYMDERQGRLHTATSYIRPGNRPASVIPPAPARPVVTVAPRTDERPLAIPAAQIDAVRRSNGCLASEIGGPEEARTFALGNGRTLILLSCGAGAYNYNSVPLIAWRDGRDIRIEEGRLDVPPQEGVDETPRYYLTNAEWDPDRRMIHEYAKGRGLGDCGVRSSYAWTGEIFRLVEQEEMSECRGTFFYLTTWRAEVR